MIDTGAKTLRRLCFAVLLSLGSPLAAEESFTAMSDADLRSLVPFGAETYLKYAECQTKTFPTCTYIWGLADSSDAARVAMGGKPDGDKLMTVFAQATGAKDFDRVLSGYKDAVPVENLGAAAVWSEARDQLSLITDDNLIIHVHVQIMNPDDTKTRAMQVATFLLAAREQAPPPS